MKKYLPWIGLVARLVLGGTLIVAGYLKFDELDKSQMAVRAYELLPIPLANFMGVFLPFFELAVGILLVLGAATRLSALASGLLMFAFMIGISQAWARGLSIDCGCFGGGGQVDPGEADYLTPLLRDTGLTLLAVYLTLFPHTKFGLDEEPKSLTQPGEGNND
ncbi:DoxX family protein [Candidatus Planktophila sulfonica]|uniref:DoxX family protein n=1 Tax=Candidatus Planktophila sulfonica TaxID=1884904 RepID=A0A249KGD9_9ACTN|nr:MauE/DoxX family redox-associated membrane protein [Candidatus Planktophila sulfonica]ASY15854.1 DoxX family protein [Candidatus Planktophila sulfonica]